MSLRIVMTTFEKARDAESTANEIIKRKLAACVKTSPMSSMYTWNGKIVKSKEMMLSATTSSEKVNELVSFLKRNHKYDVPEIVEISAKSHNSAYERWIENETQ